MKRKIPIQIIEIETGNYHLILPSVFTNGSKLNWVVDTGASKTAFDKNLVEFYQTLDQETEELHTAGIGENKIETTMANLNECWFGKMQVNNLKVALLDLSHVNQLYKKSTNIEICGLLGSDFLMKYKAVIDYNKEILVLKN